VEPCEAHLFIKISNQTLRSFTVKKYKTRVKRTQKNAENIIKNCIKIKPPDSVCRDSVHVGKRLYLNTIKRKPPDPKI
jgi:hypothetical protein